MNDRELLERAAKAAGYEWQDELWNESRIRRPDRLWEPWNPLTDDGDAFRLAVKLGLLISPVFMHELSICRFLDGETDEVRATRRAIVRAAAMVNQ